MKQSPPILIYQMGKVGSATIKASLDALGIANEHIHFLSPQGIAEAEAYYADLLHVPLPPHIQHGKQLQQHILNSRGQAKWKVITLVREPVARDISDLFQNIGDSFPHLNTLTESQALAAVTDHLQKLFANFNEITDYACTWFDKEIKPMFGVDLYAAEFDRERGYQIYRSDLADILLVKLEKLSDCYQQAFQEFLGLDQFRLVKANTAQQKPYHHLYQKLLRSLVLPPVVLDKIYASRHARHFYSAAELDHFKQRWSGGEHPAAVVGAGLQKTDVAKKIIIIHPEGNINNNPNLNGIVEILCEQGYQVHYYAPAGDHGPLRPPCSGATIFSIENGHFDLHDRYDLVIGVDRGIIPAARVARDLGVPCGFISYEIFFADEAGAAYKQPEIDACRDISFAVSQDEVRAGHLSRENQIPLKKFMHIPVVGRGINRGAKNHLLHDALGLDAAKKIVLYAGSIDYTWSMINEVFTGTSRWDDSWALVLHHRYGRSAELVADLHKQFPTAKNIYASPFPVLPFEEMHKLMHAADLCIAFYQPRYTTIFDGKNLKYMGLSSGKIATYLQYGLPVMINSIGQMSDYVKQHGLGLVVEEPANIPRQLQQLDREALAQFSENCCAFFSEKLDLDRTIAPLLKKIAQLTWQSLPQTEPAPTVIDQTAPQYLVSAIISTYNAERFMRGRLQNLVEQTLYQQGQLEIIVIDSNSPQNEGAIVKEFVAQYPHITYQRTAQRETVYAAWNRAIELSRGRYIINANTDDRFAPDALERLAAALEADPALDAAYGDWLVTQAENDTFDSNSDKFIFHYPEFSPPLFLYYHITTHSAMLRRSVFERIGPYDGDFKVLGDRELMLRFSATGLRAKKIPGVVGLYLENPGSLERTGGTFHQELTAIRQRFLEAPTFARLFGQDSPPDDKQLAQLYAEAGSLGKNFYEWDGQSTNDFALAAQLCFKAIELDPANIQAMNNLAVIACVETQHREGRRILDDALKVAPADVRASLAANRALAEQGATQLEAYHWLTTHRAATGYPPGFSFCIISGGQRPEKLARLIDSIHAQNIDRYEIIVAGNDTERPDTTYIPLPEQAQSGQTSVLRNAAAARSQYSHLVFADDDIILQPGWFAGVQPHAAEYDMLTTKLLNMDGTRHWDWAAISPANKQRMLNYGAKDADLYLTSGLLMVKRQVWETIHWNERLGFYQQEDVDFSKRALRAGFTVKFCPDSVALHNDYRYTQIGRGVWQRSEAGIAAWLNQSLLESTPQQLTQQAVAHVNGQRLGDAADCLRVSFMLDENYAPARELWDELVRALGGAIDEGTWSPQPIGAGLMPSQKPEKRKSEQAQTATTLVYWEGSQFVNHSMALINREFCLRLANQPQIELSVIPYEADQFDPVADPRYELITQHLYRPLSGPAQVHIRHQWPPNFIPPAEGHWVMIQPWEFGSIPKRWIELMRAQVDEVWAYTHYVRDCYIRSGMPADRVHVVSPGVDIKQFRPQAPPLALQTKKRYKFLFVGGTIERKGIDILLEVYTQTFAASDDVCLVVKDMGGSSFYKGQTARQLIEQIQADANAPEIEYIDRFLSDDELAGLYTACNCLVHPYRGEGFALPIAEAMASGLPVIVTGHGAALDFCSDERAYLIPAEEVRMSNVKRTINHETIDYPWWANPDRVALAGLMRHVMANSAEARAKGQAGLAFIRKNFTWAHGAAAAVKRIETVKQRPIVRFEKRQLPPETLVVLPVPDKTQLQQLGDCLRGLERYQPETAGRMAVRLVKPKEISLELQYRLQIDEASELSLLPALQAVLQNGSTKYIVVVSHQVQVTNGWLDKLIAVAESDSAIAVVGPLSNIAPEQQQVSAHYPRDGKRLQKFAAKIARQHRNKWTEVSQLGDFCLLLKREAVLAAGGLAPAGSLTETLGDLYARLEACQFKLVCAQGVFVQQRADIKQTGSTYGTASATPLSQLQRGVGGEGRTAVSNAVTPPPNLPVRLERAQSSDNWSEAINLLQQMTDQAQGSQAADLWNRLGYCYIQNGQPFEAEMAFNRGLEMAPKNLDLLTNLADLYLRQEHYNQASTYLNRALQVDPDDVPLLLSLGDCAIRLGAMDTAVMAFQRVHALAPETEGIDVVLRELVAVGP